MRTAIAFLVISALSPAAVKMPVHAQTTAPPQFNSRSSNELSVVIEGCINRRRLQPNLTAPVTRQVFELLDTKELRLEGAGGLMRTLEKEHDGHQDEITGIVIVPKDRDIRAKTGQAGPRTRVTVTADGQGPDPRPGSSRQTPSALDNTLKPQEALPMRVTAIRHLANDCGHLEYKEKPAAVPAGK
jgi:hypothetical protein